MSLRAGYYGIKRFLCNKLETIAGTYDETIKSLFPRSEQAVLGVKNRFDYKASNTPYSVMVTYISDGINVKTTSEGTWRNTGYVLQNLLTNKSYKFECDVDWVSGQAGVYIDGSTDGTNYTTIVNTNPSTADTHISLTFNTENYTYIRIKFHTTYGASGNGEVNYTKIMIYDSADTDPTYAPYAMTNRELTDEVATLNGSAADQKTAINAIITAATGAADFAAFKTAMGAITPVTRSLSLTKEDITEEVKETEPEKTVTKKRTTKKTEEV